MCLAEKQYHCLIGWRKLPLGTHKFRDITHSEYAVLAPLTRQMLQSTWTAKTSDLDAATGRMKRVNSYLLLHCNFLLIFNCFFFTSSFWSKVKQRQQIWEPSRNISEISICYSGSQISSKGRMLAAPYIIFNYWTSFYQPYISKASNHRSIL